MRTFFVVLTTILFYLLTYSSASDEFSQFDLYFTSTLVALAVCIQLSICFFINNIYLKHITLSFFLILNISSINLIINQQFMFQPSYIRYIGISLGLFIIITLMDAMSKNGLLAKVVMASLSLAISVVLIQTNFQNDFLTQEQPRNLASSAENINLVKFIEKPNVYFISFDSLIPKSITKPYMSINKTAYHDILDDEFKNFNNFFADFVPTKESLNSLLAFDRNYFIENYYSKSWYGFFSGRKSSPLLEIFKHNGYQTNTFFKSAYFGKRGPLVDNYFLEHENKGICQFIEGRIRKLIAFFSYCNFTEQRWVWSIEKRLMGRNSIQSNGTKHSSSVEFMLKNMREGLTRTKPQIFVSYIYSPGHARKDYDIGNSDHREEFMSQFKERSKRTAIELKNIIDFVKQRDPKSILFVFGDHGPFMSRHMNYEDDEVFFVHDRFAVYGGIHPRNRCADSFDKPYNEKFVTILQVAHMIVRCLSGGIDAFKKPVDYRLPPSSLYGIDGNSRYESFLYE